MMKCLTTILKIIAIVLNTIFLAVILSIVCSKYGGYPQDLRDQVVFFLMFAFPAVTLITIALTFYKKVKILTSILKIIAIILNVSFLVIFIFVAADSHIVNLLMWIVCVIGFVLPVVNVLAVALTFRKEKEQTMPE